MPISLLQSAMRVSLIQRQSDRVLQAARALRKAVSISAMAVLLGACAAKVPEAASPPSSPAPAIAPAAPDPLGTWYWVGLLGPAAETHDIDASRYSLELAAEGVLNVGADCNRGRGSYSLKDRDIRFGPIATTKIGCPEDSLDRQFLAGLAQGQRWSAGTAWARLELQGDAGVMHFARVPEARLVAYRCKIGAPLWIAFGAQHARVMIDGEMAELALLPSGSGARYGDGQRFIHTQADELALSGFAGTRAECKRSA